MKNHGGIGTYVRNLLPHLHLESIAMSSPIYSLKEQLEYPLRIPPCDLFWSPHFNVPLASTRAKKMVVTIHDLFHLDNDFPFMKKAWAKTLLKKAVKEAAHIITVSEFTKSRILHHFPRARNKISVISPGADHLLLVQPKPLPHLSPFFLAVGSKKEHKNLALIRDRIPNLVIVEEGTLPIENLCWLYQNAEALIFPSLYEGWGLPPLEAMSLGCPVIASHTASIPEACEDAALYFNPHSFEDLQRALQLLPAKREELIAKGKKRAAELTWWRAAEEHERIFQTILH